MAKTLVALITALCLAFPAFAAQSRAAQKKEAKPAWTELTPAQQQVLEPLVSEWNDMDTTRRKKWVAIANRYPKMKPQEQQRLQKRMKEWAALTPEQRRMAREKYQNVQKLPTSKRKDVRQQWQEYQRSLAAQPEISPSDPPAPPDTATPETPAAAPATGATTEQ